MGTSLCFTARRPVSGRVGVSVAPPGNAKTFDFNFDRVLRAAGQAEVFAEIAHLVQSALDAYKVCIFTYGQTGSGRRPPCWAARPRKRRRRSVRRRRSNTCPTPTSALDARKRRRPRRV